MYESFEEPNNRWKHVFDLANKEITFLLHAMTVCNKTRKTKLSLTISYISANLSKLHWHESRFFRLDELYPST